MPAVTQPTYPGVYVEEIPSQTHTVTGATTSSTAFVDFFSRGPTDKAVQVNNFTEFTRTFGGLDRRSEASYGVLQFFNNGGQMAWVARVGNGSWELSRTSIPVHEPSLETLSDDASTAAQAAQAAAQLAAKNEAQQPSAKLPEYEIALEVATDTQQAATQTLVAAASTSAASKILSTNITEWDAEYGPVAAATQLVAAAASDAAQLASAKATAAANAAAAAESASTVLTAGTGDKSYDKDIGKATSAAGKLSQPATALATAAAQLVTDAQAIDVAQSGTASEYVLQAVTQANVAEIQANLASAAAGAAGSATTNAVPPAGPGDPGYNTFVRKNAASGAMGQVSNALTAVEQTLSDIQQVNDAFAAAEFLATNDPNAKSQLKAIQTAAKDSAKAVTSAQKLLTDALAAQAAMALALGDVDPGGIVHLAASTAATAASAAQVAAVKATAASQAAQSDESLAGGPALDIMAANPGLWGNNLRVAVVNQAANQTRFTLVIKEIRTVGGRTSVASTETFTNLTLEDQYDPKFAPTYVNHNSQLVQLDFPWPAVGGTYPEGMTQQPQSILQMIPLMGGDDGGLASPQQLVYGASGTPESLGMIALLDGMSPAIFNILCLPAIANFSSGGYNYAFTQALEYAGKKRAFYIPDIPASVNSVDDMQQWMQSYGNAEAYNAGSYFPRLTVPDPLQHYRPRNVGPSGTLAGIYARTDQAFGVWQSPAGIDAVLEGADITLNLNDDDTGTLNQLGANVLRSFAVYGNVVWGARTLAGADLIDSDWKYINVRRLADFIEDSLVQSLKWVVFENNGPRLWSNITAEVGSFMASLFADGAFQGETPDKAYLVVCDETTTTQTDIDNGIVNILVGFAPQYPAEFVFVQIEQLTAS